MSFPKLICAIQMWFMAKITQRISKSSSLFVISIWNERTNKHKIKTQRIFNIINRSFFVIVRIFFEIVVAHFIFLNENDRFRR